jgi:MoaA/NifB/PqqE/SkfB family radical SAM enzyme
MRLIMSKLWIYTNYDCNLTCAYCSVESSPTAPRRALSLSTVQQLIDEALALNFSEVFFTGGEPFILDEIYAMLAYAATRVKTTVLTNAMLLKGSRLDRLRAIQHDNLIVQVSLDGARPDQHDAWRGTGSFAKTIEGIRSLQANGFRVRVATTTTAVNSAHLDEVCDFHRALGIPEEDHLIRSLAKRGFSSDGLEVGMATLAPELTVNVEGVFWHPISTAGDMQISKQIFPLAAARDRMCEIAAEIAHTGTVPPITFT